MKEKVLDSILSSNLIIIVPRRPIVAGPLILLCVVVFL